MIPDSLRVYIALGSNLGDSSSLLRRAMDRLENFSARPLRRSSLWRSTPVDCPPGSPPFVNAAVEMIAPAAATPELLLGRLQELERQFGRRPKQVLNEPRPLDLDLISFGEEIRTGRELVLPHPRAHLRRFVLEPLAEIAPDLVLPGFRRNVELLLRELPRDAGMARLGGAGEPRA